MNPLEDLANKYGSDKGSSHNGHRFTDVYYGFWEPIRQKVKSVLEIGIFKGGSLLMLRDFFPNATIFGIDIRDGVPGGDGEPIGALASADRIVTSLCSQIDNDRIDSLFSNKTFDLIIDDACHNPIFQQESLGYLFKYLNPGGLYIIEDLHTSLMGEKWGLCPTDPNTCLNTLIRFNEEGELKSSYIREEYLTFLNEHISKIEIFDTKQFIQHDISPDSTLVDKCNITAIITKKQ
jgi:hypothetical protein